MDEQGVDLRSLLGLLRRQIRLIVATCVIGLAVAGLALFLLKPVYTASSLVMVDTSHKDVLAPDDSQGLSASADNTRVDSEVELVKSETTLLSAVRELDLINDPEFGVSIGLRDRILAFLRIAQPRLPTGQEALQSVVGNLRDAITVQRRGITYLISISAKALRPETAAKIANAVAEAYIREQLGFKVQSTLAARDIIQSRIADSRATVASSEDAFDRFISTNLTTIAADTGRPDLLDLGQQLSQVDDERAQNAARAQVAQQYLNSQDWDALATTLQSEALAKLERDKAALEQSLSQVVAGTQPALDLQSELTRLDTQLNATAVSEYSSLTKSVSEAQAQASDLRTKLRTGALSAGLSGDMLTSIYALQQTAENARTQYQTMLQRAAALDAQAYLQVADSRVVAEATPPDSPSFPNPRLILTLAGLASLGLGIGLAFLVENFVGGFTSEGQLESVLRVHVVASVPRQKASGSADGTIAQTIVSSPLSGFSESIRRIRFGVDQALRRARAVGPAAAADDSGKRSAVARRSLPRAPEQPTTGGVVVAVTSAVPGDGKTTMALSMARGFALTGRSTLLIDCDFRKPSIHRQLGLEPSSALVDILTASGRPETSLKQLAVADVGGETRVILGSRRGDVATDQLLASSRFSDLVAEARQEFDVVILDTPPVGPVVDAVYLAPLADAIVFVVRWAATSQHDARMAVNTLIEAKRPQTEIVAVLNQQASARSGYRGRYSSYYTS